MTKFIYKDIIAEKYIELQEQALLESRIDFIKKQFDGKINTDHDSYATHKDTSNIVDHFAEHGDPTKKKLYTQWIVGQYQKGQTKQEDTDRIHSTLSNFDKYKSKLPEKDINKYNSLADVDDAVKPHIGTASTKAEQRANEEHAGQELKFEDPHIKIYHLKTKEASQHLYGGGTAAGKTNWCTAAKSENCMFDHYAKDGKLHVVHDKESGKVYQYHVNSSSFMDAEDNPIDSKEFKKIAPSLHKAWDQHPELLD